MNPNAQSCLLTKLVKQVMGTLFGDRVQTPTPTPLSPDRVESDFFLNENKNSFQLHNTAYEDL